jgi:uncharacterized repeat protein (TIGR01451 family)
MRLFRGVSAVLLATTAALVVSAEKANATPTVQPPTVTKSFGSSTIPLNRDTSLVLQVSNPNPTTTLTGVSVTDTLPAGLVAIAPILGSACGGTLTVTSSTISFTGATVEPNNPCIFGATVQGTTLGTKVNTTSAVTSTNGGTGDPATATLVVAHQPPTLTKVFLPSTVRVGETTTLRFTLRNPNPIVALSRITFADPFPSGLAVAASPAVTNTCGGVPSVGPFALAVAYANANLPPGGSCTFSVQVTATSAGVKNNTTTIVTSTPGGIGSPAIGTLTVTG